MAGAHDFLRASDPEEYATALFGLLNLRTHTLVFANAGHPPPLMATPRETVYLEYPRGDLPLGIEDRFMPALHEVEVPGSTLLVFYTDGVTEHERKPLQGAAELRDAAIFATKFSHRFQSRRRRDPHGVDAGRAGTRPDADEGLRTPLLAGRGGSRA